MPYTLLFSRSIQSDAVMRITDVPIADKNVMIEVLSLMSPFRRLAGYAYALRSDGITDYERSSGVTLPFGKNRVNFGSATVPYGLEFFPKFGIRSGIISVYVGEPTPPLPPTEDWKAVSSQNIEFRLAQNPNRIDYRRPIGSSVVESMALGAIAGAATQYGDMVWRTATGFFRTTLDDMLFVRASTESDHNNFYSNENLVIF